MTTTFTGEVRIPGSIENGLPSTITLDAQTLVLTAGGTELGRWNRSDLKLRREADGTFHLTLGREVVLFNPDSPLEFAILSGMPGAGTAPAPAADEPAAPVVPEPAAPAPTSPIAAVPAMSPAPATDPAAPAVPPTPPAPQPSASTPPPAVAQSSPTAPSPEIAAPVAAQPAVAPAVASATPAPAPAPAPAPEVPDVAPADIPPAAPANPPPAVTAPPQTAAHPAAPAPADPPAEPPVPQPAAAPPIAAVPAAAVEIQLEESTGPVGGGDSVAAPSTGPLDPALAFPPSEPEGAEGPPPAAPPRSGQSKDFWDGFYSEEQEAAAMLGEPAALAEAPTDQVATDQVATDQVATDQVATDQASGFLLQDDREDASDDDAAKVGGYGSGLFKDDADSQVQPPPFGEDESADGEDRVWSYYDEADGEQADGEQADGDRGWSYDDDPAEAGAEEDDADEPPAFRSPVADREDLVVSAKSSRFSGIAGWRPSLPSFFGSSALGTRARDALGVLDAILEENGTDDIPKSFIIGLGGFAALLGVVALLIVLFG